MQKCPNPKHVDVSHAREGGQNVMSVLYVREKVHNFEVFGKVLY